MEVWEGFHPKNPMHPAEDSEGYPKVVGALVISKQEVTCSVKF